MAAAYVADYTSKKHDGTKACGGFSGAAMNSVDQNRSTIFDVEPAVKKMSTGQLPKSRVAEDEKLSNPYRQQYVPPPRPVSTMAPAPVDISDMSIADPLAEAQARQMEEASLTSRRRSRISARRSAHAAPSASAASRATSRSATPTARRSSIATSWPSAFAFARSS